MPYRIFLVENPASEIQLSLETLGYQVVARAPTAEIAIALVREMAPEVILINIGLPGSLDGIEIAGRIRTFSMLPIIFMSTSVDEEILALARQTTPSGFLVKPVKDIQLHATIQMALYKYNIEEHLRKSEERFELAMAATNDGMWDWNLKTDEVYYSPRWKAMLGYHENEIGTSPDEWLKRVHPDDAKQFQVDIVSHINGFSPRIEREYRIKHADGRIVWMLMRGLAVRDGHGSAYRLAGSQTDITTRKLTEERLAYDALHDALTGLPNRVLFMDRLTFRIERTKRHPDELFAVLFLDLDRFKVVNDSLGHSAGDQLLITTALRIQQCLRPEDTVSRLSGDEFAILLNEVHDVSDGVRVADRIRSRLVTTTLLGAVERSPTASIGIAMFHNNYEKPDEILRDADLAMYRAKTLGRNRHQIFDSTMFAGAVALLQMEGELKRAVARREWQVLYQPIVSLGNSETIGVEALLRWQHPERGVVFPLEFISVAEDTGYIVPIGEHVLVTACQQVKEWRDAGQSKLWVAVNISARQFQDDNLVGMVARILAETGLSPDGLRLEVTESVAMQDLEYSIRILRELDKLGVYASLDDFGTGYSSLSYLKRFPLKVLKIDQSFIQDIQINKNSEAITMAVIAMARSLNLEVVAEGVEKVEQMDFLRSLVCDHVQGFFLSQPLSAEELSDAFDKKSRKSKPPS
jgi:diguanylate cyclase (GGDEF)-like protein/PAS domain S-box-containing protein